MNLDFVHLKRIPATRGSETRLSERKKLWRLPDQMYDVASEVISVEPVQVTHKYRCGASNSAQVTIYEAMLARELWISSYGFPMIQLNYTNIRSFATSIQSSHLF